MSLERLSEVLAETTGFDTASVGRGGLVAALSGRVDLEDAGAVALYVERVAQDPEARASLLSDLLVHETSFFRYPGSFAFLAEEVCRRLAAGARRVRILSAPCSTGQEPASVVMALLEAGIERGAFVVDALDLSTVVVARARAGVYNASESRSLSPARRARFARPAGNGIVLLPEVLGSIRYQQGDLLDPASVRGMGPYDLVLCRNLLIYLTAQAREHIVRVLEQLMAADGLLMLGHAEVAPSRPLGLVPVGPPEAYVVAEAVTAAERGGISRPGARGAAGTAAGSGAAAGTSERAPAGRPGAGRPGASPAGAAQAAAARPGALRPPAGTGPASPARARPALPLVRPVLKAPARTLVPAAVAGAGPAPGEVAPEGAAGGESVLVRARRLGQDGQAEQALALLAEAEGMRTPTPDELHLAAVLTRALERPEETRRALTRALYLDPRHVPSLRLAALVAEEEGDRESARRLEGRAERALAQALQPLAPEAVAGALPVPSLRGELR